MASILRVNTLTDASSNNSVPMATVSQGSAKAWLTLNGQGTIAARDSFNTASITDNGTGDYTLNFSSSTANINYSISGGTDGGNNSHPSSPSVSGDIRFNSSTSSPYKSVPTTSAFTMTISTDANLASAIDVEWAMAKIHGDLA
jgi:hypothetical protein